MKRLEEVLGELAYGEAHRDPGVDRGGMGPARDATTPGHRFRPVDVARLRLIQELRQDLEIGPEAMPVVLSLVDEMYTLRRRLAALARAVARGARRCQGRRHARNARTICYRSIDPETNR